MTNIKSEFRNAKVKTTTDAKGNWEAVVEVPMDRESFMIYELSAPSQSMLTQLIVAVLFKKFKGELHDR